VTARRGTWRWLAALILTLAFCPPLAAQDNPLVQRGIPAEASAENAVAARDAAIASARRIAFQRMAEQLGGGAPSLSDRQIEGLVGAMIVEEERTTATRYIGRLTFQFQRGAVGSALGRSVSGLASGGAGLSIPMAATGSIAATVRTGSLPAWLEARRRMLQSGAVVRVEVLEISMDTARVRLGLSRSAEEAAAALSAMGLAVEPGGPGWQVGLAGGG
jgi:hypothetical protein